jgi:hypothetical protein
MILRYQPSKKLLRNSVKDIATDYRNIQITNLAANLAKANEIVRRLKRKGLADLPNYYSIVKHFRIAYWQGREYVYVLYQDIILAIWPSPT